MAAKSLVPLSLQLVQVALMQRAGGQIAGVKRACRVLAAVFQMLDVVAQAQLVARSSL